MSWEWKRDAQKWTQVLSQTPRDERRERLIDVVRRAVIILVLIAVAVTIWLALIIPTFH